MPGPSVVESLAPAFSAGFALQRLIELLDPLTNRLGNWKKPVLGWSSFVIGLTAASTSDSLHILKNLIASPPASMTFSFLDILVSALVLSAGTEGFNSILKLLEYKKEETKESAPLVASTPAAIKKAQEALASIPLPEPEVS